MARLLALLVTLALLLPPAAIAQTGGGGAFGPLPPAQPAETPPPEPEDLNPSDDISREALFLVALGVVLAFAGLGWAITRDARRNLDADDRAAVEGTRGGAGAPRKQDRAKLKQKARQKTRAQRRARKKARR